MSIRIHQLEKASPLRAKLFRVVTGQFQTYRQQVRISANDGNFKSSGSKGSFGETIKVTDAGTLRESVSEIKAVSP